MTEYTNVSSKIEDIPENKTPDIKISKEDIVPEITRTEIRRIVREEGKNPVKQQKKTVPPSNSGQLSLKYSIIKQIEKETLINQGKKQVGAIIASGFRKNNKCVPTKKQSCISNSKKNTKYIGFTEEECLTNNASMLSYISNNKPSTSYKFDNPFEKNDNNNDKITNELLKLRTNDNGESLSDLLRKGESIPEDKFKSIINSFVSTFSDKNNVSCPVDYISNKHSLLLLNFEDDTFRPVLKTNDKSIDVIKSWYEKCNQIIDIEETAITFSKTLSINALSKIVNKNFELSHKHIFLNEYIPEILKMAEIESKINSIESNIKKDASNKENENATLYKNVSLEELKINIPENLIYKDRYFYKKDNETKFMDDDESNFSKKTFTSGYYDHTSKSTDHEIIHPSSCLEKDDSNEFQDESSNFYGEFDNLSNSFPAYNSTYDVLRPCFGDNCESIEPVVEIKELPKKASPYQKLIIVLLNPILLQTTVLNNPDKFELETMKNCSEYGFIELFTINNNNEELSSFIEKQYDGTLFNDVDEINNKLETTSQYLEFIKTKKTNSSPFSEEESSVKEYLTKYYEITNDIAMKMKASMLHDHIVESGVCKIDNDKLSGFKNRLSQYLKDLGLQKKRYNDGYYYYGIALKEIKQVSTSNVINFSNRTIDDVINDRKALNKEVNVKLGICNPGPGTVFPWNNHE